MSMTEEQFINKIIWEGGVMSALEYGLRQDHLEEPNTPLGHAWGELLMAWREIDPKVRAVEALIPDDAW